jgi:ChrB-like protein
VTARSAPRRHRPAFSFLVLVYRVPPAPAAARVAVWRQLKKVGAIYLQQSVCVFPDIPEVRAELATVLDRIDRSSGEYHLLPISKLTPEEEQKIVSQFVDQTSRHYQEIVENCEVNFQKEIEFETFRKNFTYEEAEEIRSEYDKIVDWFARVRRRDWFSVSGRAEVEGWLRRCRHMLEGFEARVYAAQSRGNGATPPLARAAAPSSRATAAGRRRASPRAGRDAVRATRRSLAGPS